MNAKIATSSRSSRAAAPVDVRRPPAQPAARQLRLAGAAAIRPPPGRALRGADRRGEARRPARGTVAPPAETRSRRNRPPRRDVFFLSLGARLQENGGRRSTKSDDEMEPASGVGARCRCAGGGVSAGACVGGGAGVRRGGGRVRERGEAGGEFWRLV